MVSIVAAAPPAACACTSRAIVSAVISGTSPASTTTGRAGSMCSAAQRTASPVPRGAAWTASAVRSGRWGASARSGPPTTTTRCAPASSAARAGHATIGRPQIGCSTFGSGLFMRVPWPAASTTTTGERMLVEVTRCSMAAGRAAVKARLPRAGEALLTPRVMTDAWTEAARVLAPLLDGARFELRFSLGGHAAVRALAPAGAVAPRHAEPPDPPAPWSARAECGDAAGWLLAERVPTDDALARLVLQRAVDRHSSLLLQRIAAQRGVMAADMVEAATHR